MFSIRKSVVTTLALAAFVSGGAALATASVAAAAVPADREVSVTSFGGGTDPHLIQSSADPGSSMSGTPVATNGTRITF